MLSHTPVNVWPSKRIQSIHAVHPRADEQTLYKILIHVCIPEAGGTFGITWRWIQCCPVTMVCGGITSCSVMIFSSCKLNFALFLLTNFHPFFLFSSFLSSCLFHCKKVNMSRSPHAGRVCQDELESTKEKIKVGKIIYGWNSA